MIKKYDVAIVGSGPAGSIAAYHLAQAGLKTVIVEKAKLPRYKVCGGGVVGKVHDLIPFDFGHTIDRSFNSVDINFQREGLDFTVNRESPIVSMVMRSGFDQNLVSQATTKGAELIENCKVSALDINGSIKLNSNYESIQAQFVIAADGAYSNIAKFGGWKETRYNIPAIEYEVYLDDQTFNQFNRTVRFDIDAMDKGYGWVFPKKDHLSIGLGTFLRGKMDLRKKYKEYLNFLGIKNPIEEHQYGYQIPVRPRKDGFFKNSVLLAGDAAGLADPVTAEGISCAILSGKLAAQSIIDAELDAEKVNTLYNKALDNSFLEQYKTANYLADVMYNHQWLRKMVISRYGQKMAESMTDLFMGKRQYPSDIPDKILRYVKLKK